MKEGDDAEVKPETKTTEDTDKGEESKKTSEDDASMQDAEAQPKVVGPDSTPQKTDETDNAANEPAKVQESQEDANGKAGAAEDYEAKKGEIDSIMIPGNPHTLLIKSLSPEISRADLEAVSWSSGGCLTLFMYVY